MSNGGSSRPSCEKAEDPVISGEAASDLLKRRSGAESLLLMGELPSGDSTALVLLRPNMELTRLSWYGSEP